MDDTRRISFFFVTQRNFQSDISCEGSIHSYETTVPVSSIYIKTNTDETRWHDRHLVMTVTKIIHKSQPSKDLYFPFTD